MFKQTLTVALMTSFAACGSADGEWKVSGGWTSFSEKDELLEARTFCGKHRRGGAVGSVLPMQDICLSFVNGKALYTDAEHTTFETNDKGSYEVVGNEVYVSMWDGGSTSYEIEDGVIADARGTYLEERFENPIGPGWKYYFGQKQEHLVYVDATDLSEPIEATFAYEFRSGDCSPNYKSVWILPGTAKTYRVMLDCGRQYGEYLDTFYTKYRGEITYYDNIFSYTNRTVPKQLQCHNYVGCSYISK